MCVLSRNKSRRKLKLIGNTTGHVDCSKANCFDPERTSPVHQIGLEISPQAPQGVGALLGEQGRTREGAGRPSPQLRKTGGTRGRARGTRQPACLTGLPGRA